MAATRNLEAMRDKDPVEYVGMKGVGAWLGVSAATVRMWRGRYAEKRDASGKVIDPGHPTPVPDVIVEGRHPGWLPEREPEWRVWAASRDGQGAGGGPKPRRSSGGANR